jgi:hypothetical protein
MKRDKKMFNPFCLAAAAVLLAVHLAASVLLTISVNLRFSTSFFAVAKWMWTLFGKQSRLTEFEYIPLTKAPILIVHTYREWDIVLYVVLPYAVLLLLAVLIRPRQIKTHTLNGSKNPHS